MPARKRNVLVYSSRKIARSTVRRAYQNWREQNALPPRCDNTTCTFHSAQLVWNGASLPLILDHIEGNRFDNRPESLRYLCPNCDSQQSTKGGGNRGRLASIFEQGFIIQERDGRKSYTYFASGGAKIGGSAIVEFVPGPDSGKVV